MTQSGKKKVKRLVALYDSTGVAGVFGLRQLAVLFSVGEGIKSRTLVAAIAFHQVIHLFACHQSPKNMGMMT